MHEGDCRSSHRILIQKSIRGTKEDFKSNVEPGDFVDVILYKGLELILSEERIIQEKETDFDIL